ncbi:hypothetical protein CDAR_46931 [Caerostris darwini]|uniref:Uncharacterized protein n=1 Tax=Caerostris darwini TaxID=1538125 RepID=A0AAV4S9Q2_9ARAC|nr:hypothetical protein CDAR_46931 [Caerostris darwini]
MAGLACRWKAGIEDYACPAFNMEDAEGEQVMKGAICLQRFDGQGALRTCRSRVAINRKLFWSTDASTSRSRSMTGSACRWKTGIEDYACPHLIWKTPKGNGL